MIKRIAIALLICVTMARGADVFLGDVSDITWTGSGTNYYASFGVDGWADPNSYVALWEMETTNTTQTLDTASGGTNSLTLTPSVAAGPAWTIAGTNVDGRVEHSYYFDGVDDRLVGGLDASYNTSTGTISFWVFMTGDTFEGTAFTLMENDSIAATELQVTIEVSATKHTVDIWCRTDGTMQWRARTTAAHALQGYTNQWAFMTIRQGGTEPQLHVNTDSIPLTFDTAVDKTKWADDCFAATAPVDHTIIGAFQYDGATFLRPFLGYLDQVSITAEVMTTNTMQEFVDNTIPTNNIRIR